MAPSVQQGQADPAPQLPLPSHCTPLICAMSSWGSAQPRAGHRLLAPVGSAASTASLGAQGAFWGKMDQPGLCSCTYAADPALPPALLCLVRTPQAAEGWSRSHSTGREGSQLWRILKSSKSQDTPALQTRGGWREFPVPRPLARTPVGARTLSCTSGAFRAVGSGCWLKELGDGETEAKLWRSGHCAPSAVGRCLCRSGRVARCIAQHPPVGLRRRWENQATCRRSLPGISLLGWPRPRRAAVMDQGQAGGGDSGDGRGGLRALGGCRYWGLLALGGCQRDSPQGRWAHGARRGAELAGTPPGDAGASSGVRGDPPGDGTGRGTRGRRGSPSPAGGHAVGGGLLPGAGMGPGAERS